jgi:glucokinase
MMVAGADPHVLLADVGGTHVRFALADPAATAPLLEDSIRVQRVDDWPTFTDAARSYLAQCGAHCHQGVFAFAGPVVDGQVRMTNHPWTIAQDAVQEALGLASLELVNDFAAMSLAACLLADGDGEVLGGAGVPRLRADGSQVFAVLGPGTGLGAGALMLHDGEAATLDTEGGHTGFAPADDLQVAVWMRLAARFGRVSNERLLCGSGLANLHRALAEVHGEEAATWRPKPSPRVPPPGTRPARAASCCLRGCLARSQATACWRSAPGTACSSRAGWCIRCCRGCDSPVSAPVSRTRGTSPAGWRACRCSP